MIDIDKIIVKVARVCYGGVAMFDLMFCLGIINVRDSIFPLLICANIAVLLYLIVYYTEHSER